MADISRDKINEVVSRVMDEVANEVKALDGGFRVTDLHSQLANLGKANGNVAWTISYSTSSANVASQLGEVAWTISYSTSSAAVEKGLTGGR